RILQVGPLERLNEIGDLAYFADIALGRHQLALPRNRERHAVLGADVRVEHDAQADPVWIAVAILDGIVNESGVQLRRPRLIVGDDHHRLRDADLARIIPRRDPLAVLDQLHTAEFSTAFVFLRPVSRSLAVEVLRAIDADAGVVVTAVLHEREAL